MKNKILYIILCVCCTFTLMAQTGDNSPYSRFGIGDLSDDAFQHLKQMGSLGNAYTDAFQINIKNPASYSFLRTTAFDMGIYAKNGTLKTEDQSASQWTGNLEYLSLGFPLYNPLNQLLDREQKDISIGMTFTLKPYSTVSYDLYTDDTSIDSLGTFQRTYTGQGGTYKFLWGNSIKYKDFAFGANLGYLFGKITYNRSIDFNEIGLARQNRFSTDYNLKGFLYDIGLIYSKVLNKKEMEDSNGSTSKTLKIGLTFNSATSFSTESNIQNLGVFFAGLAASTIDTSITSIRGQPGKGKLPGSVGLGIHYTSGEKWSIGADYNATSWSNYFNDGNNETLGTLENTNSIAVGGYVRPNYKSFTSFWKRVYYRYGAYNRSDPRLIGGEQIKSQGLTFGMGLPFIFQRKVSHANLGIDIGRSGMNTSIQENYIRFTLGFTFNDDEWFVKRKYN